MTDTLNTIDRGIGDNQPEGSLLPADALLAKLNNLYTPLIEGKAELLNDIRDSIPKVIETEADNNLIAKNMERLRSSIKTANHHREAEKADYLAAERTAQNFFAAIIDPLEKTREILQARGNAYIQRKAAEARAEAQRKADAERARLAEIARQEREAAQAAADLAAAAARARKPENIERLTIEAATQRVEAQTLAVDKMIAAQETEAAVNATHASTADMVRTRYESGHLSTGKQVGYVEITDKAQLDFIALLPYIKESILLAAVKAYAKATDHKTPMAGAVIEMRDAADYR